MLKNKKEKFLFINEIKIAVKFFELINKISKKFIPILLLISVAKVIPVIINIIIANKIIDSLIYTRDIKIIVIYAGTIVILDFLFELIINILSNYTEKINLYVVKECELRFGNITMKMEFEKTEMSKILDEKEKALYPITNQDAINKMIRSFSSLVETVLNIIGLCIIISTLNLIIILIIVAVVLLNYFVLKKSQKLQYEFFTQLLPLNRRLEYCSDLACDFSIAKDVRMYNMSNFILNKILRYQDESQFKVAKQFVRQGQYNGLISFNLNLQLIFIYIYMIYKILINSITVGQFNMYLSSAQMLSQKINQLINSWVEFRATCEYLDLYIRFQQMEINTYITEKKIISSNKRGIEFKNVSFKYHGVEEYALKNVSININSKEKLAIVGENGAGKSTFVKLLCRLYKPERGVILLNGIDINEYDNDTYFKELSLVFQDFKLYAFSVKENIAFDKAESISDENLQQLLSKIGLDKKIASLESIEDTPLYKAYNEDGVELSGGEGQKLAIARALYNNTHILVLDEPTAFLDPVAEYELYNKLNSLALNKTVIYVSHRLSSCKFCDKIAVFRKGHIIEYGTHGELINANGYYRKMWNVQSAHYFNK